MMCTVNRTRGTRSQNCFFRWTQYPSSSQLSSTMEDQFVSPLLLFSMLTMYGRERPLSCLLILTKEPSPDSGQILLTRRYVCMGTGLCKVFCSRCCLVRFTIYCAMNLSGIWDYYEVMEKERRRTGGSKKGFYRVPQAVGRRAWRQALFRRREPWVCGCCVRSFLLLVLCLWDLWKLQHRGRVPQDHCMG